MRRPICTNKAVIILLLFIIFNFIQYSCSFFFLSTVMAENLSHSDMLAGYIHNVSPVYHDKYFEFQIQAKTETVRAVCFSQEKENNLLPMTTTRVLLKVLKHKGLKLTLHQMPKVSSWEMFLLKIVPLSTFRNQSCLQQ